MRIPRLVRSGCILYQRAQYFDSFADLSRIEARETEPQSGIERPRNRKISSRQIIDSRLLGQAAKRDRIQIAWQADPHIHAPGRDFPGAHGQVAAAGLIQSPQLFLRGGDYYFLVSRKLAGAVLHDPAEAAEQALRMALAGEIRTIGGRILKRRVQTLCIHGDEPTATAVAGAIRAALIGAGVRLAALPEVGAD